MQLNLGKIHHVIQTYLQFFAHSLASLVFQNKHLKAFSKGR